MPLGSSPILPVIPAMSFMVEPNASGFLDLARSSAHIGTGGVLQLKPDCPAAPGIDAGRVMAPIRAPRLVGGSALALAPPGGLSVDPQWTPVVPLCPA
jgi:hypothetical protein